MRETIRLRRTPFIEFTHRMAERIYRNDSRILSGNPYIVHPQAVAATMQRLRFSEADIAAGLLHDGPEDHEDITFDWLMDTYADGGFDAQKAGPAVDRVRAVTYDRACASKHDQQERYRESLLACPKAIPLALADADDNMGEIVIYLETFKTNVFGRNYLNCDPRELIKGWLGIAALGFDQGGSDRRILALSRTVAERAKRIEELLRL